MNKNNSLICTLSLIAGIASYPLSFISFIFFVCTCLGRIPVTKEVFLVLFFVTIGITALTAIAGILLGIIGIKQKIESKRKAIFGIVLSSVMLVGSVCFYCFIFLRPSNMNFIFYLL